MTKDFSFSKSSWLPHLDILTMYEVDFIADFICILGIIWWSKSSRVERGICLTFAICPNPQFFFFHNTIYYWFISNGNASNFQLTIIFWFVFLPELLLALFYICGLLFYLSLNSLICSSIEVLLFFYYFFPWPFYLCLFGQFWCVLSWFCLFHLI